MWQRKWASVVKIAKTVFPSSGLESDNLGVEFEKLLLFGAEGSFWLKRKAGSCWGMPSFRGLSGDEKAHKKAPSVFALGAWVGRMGLQYIDRGISHRRHRSP